MANDQMCTAKRSPNTRTHVLKGKREASQNRNWANVITLAAPDRFLVVTTMPQAAMATRAEISTALSNNELRQHVADWKSRFFPSSWARYDLAKPGTFHLVPPESRRPELERDYLAMQPMFLVSRHPSRRFLKRSSIWRAESPGLCTKSHESLLLCATSVFSVSLWLMNSEQKHTTETQRTLRLHRETHM